MIREVLRIIVGFAIVGLLVRSYLLQGLVLPVRVASGSMAPALLGPHYPAACNACGFSWAIGAEQPPPVALECPNCRTDVAAERIGPLRAGDRVLILRSAWWGRSPRRGELVAFRGSDDPGRIEVKRIAGLPGEQLDIREGDLFVDGRRYRKSLEEQLDAAILVHDDRDRPEDPSRSRTWQAGSDSRWIATNDGWRTTGERQFADDWLAFHSPSPDEAPIVDNYPYNAGLSRRLNETRDLMLTCRLACRGQGRLVIRAAAERLNFDVQLAPALGRMEVRRGAEVVAEARFDASSMDHGVSLAVSLVDRQLLVAMDGQTVVELPFVLEENVRGIVHPPFAIAADRLDVQLDRLQVWRDVYYTDAVIGSAATDAASTPRAGFGETLLHSPSGYFLLGDNSPTSVDSRYERVGRVDAGRLLGRVLAPGGGGPSPAAGR